MTLLRSALFNVWFYGVTTVFCLGAPIIVLRLRLQGRIRGRHVAGVYARAWARTALAGLRPLAGIAWRVEGTLPESGPVLLAAQHQSAFETVLWAALLPRFCYVVKRELMEVPLFGTLLRASGMIPVDRTAGMSAMRGLLRDGTRAVAEDRQIVIFPEGTRVAPGVRAPLHPGVAALATRTGLPVIPVVTDSGRCWSRSFRKRPGTIRVQILPALPAGLPRDELLRRLDTAFAAGPG
jgi:1-acyl-sn-glycerol-3-phosphate acyltransferase